VKDIEQSRLKAVKIFSPRLNLEHVLCFNPARWKLIIIMRTSNLVWKIHRGKKTKKDLYLERREFKTYIYGYENKVGGIVVRHFNCIMPNGEVYATDNLDDILIDAVPEIVWIDEKEESK
jgi:hypothetical protein